MRRALAFIPILLFLAGCSQPDSLPAPQFTGGTNFAIVTAPDMNAGGVASSGHLKLFYYPEGPAFSGDLVWPYLAEKFCLVHGDLALFNGGLTDEAFWKYYPALLATHRTNPPVELTLPLCRTIPGYHTNWTNYAFALLTITNDTVRLDASELLPLTEDTRPKRLEVDVSLVEIERLITAAQTNGRLETFAGVQFLRAP